MLVLGPRLDGLRATIELEVDPARPGYGAAWRADANARGESLQVLPNGHLLVAKQKDPVVLVEFGPAGDAPVGLASTQLGRSGEPFRFRAESPYVVLADWQVAAGAGVRSLNDLSVDDAGRLYCVWPLAVAHHRPLRGGGRRRIDRSRRRAVGTAAGALHRHRPQGRGARRAAGPGLPGRLRQRPPRARQPRARGAGRRLKGGRPQAPSAPASSRRERTPSLR